MARKILQTVVEKDGVPNCQIVAQLEHHNRSGDTHTQLRRRPGVQDIDAGIPDFDS